MPLSCNEIGERVMRIQADFLENPRLTLTPSQAARRFHIDRLACEAVLQALTDGRVLSRDAAGTYRRRFAPGNHVVGRHRLTATTSAAA